MSCLPYHQQQMYPFVLELMTKFIMIQNQQREVMSTVAAGRAITDDDVLEMMINHTSSHSPLATTTTSTTSSVVQARQAFLNKLTVPANNESDFENDNVNDVCSLCHLFTPDKARKKYSHHCDAI